MKPVIRTYTGREVNPLDLRISDIDVHDIAHALALCNRFAGHSRFPISVAQHSVAVMRLLRGTGFERHGLFHDATEAYLGDVTKWLKATEAMAGYREAEERAEVTIALALGLVWTPEAREAVDYADRVMVRFEGRQGFGREFRINHPNYPELTAEEIEAIGRWTFWAWTQAEEFFLASARALDSGVAVY